MAIKINLTNAAPVAITCKRGDTFLMQTLRFWQDEARTIPLDITGYGFAMQVKDSDGEVVLTFAGALEFVIANTNELTITKSAEDMKVPASPSGQPYIFDCEMTDTNDVVTTIIKGTLGIEQDVTNA